jgi:hypothetical protein
MSSTTHTERDRALTPAQLEALAGHIGPSGLVVALRAETISALARKGYLIREGRFSGRITSTGRAALARDGHHGGTLRDARARDGL